MRQEKKWVNSSVKPYLTLKLEGTVLLTAFIIRPTTYFEGSQEYPQSMIIRLEGLA